MRGEDTHVKDAIDARQLDHAEDEQGQNRPRAIPPSEKDHQALPKRQPSPWLDNSLPVLTAQKLSLRLDHREIQPPKRITRANVIPPTTQQPPRRLGQQQAHAHQHTRKHNHDHKRQPPGHATLPNVDTRIAREIPNTHPRRRHRLRQPRQHAPTPSGRNLRDVHAHSTQVHALAQARNRPAQQELRASGRRGLQQGAHGEEHRAERDDAQTAVRVGEPACKDGRRGSCEHDERDGEAYHGGGQRPEGGGELRHGGHGADGARVEAVEEAAEGDGDRGEDVAGRTGEEDGHCVLDSLPLLRAVGLKS